jgi:hypothetical protein
MMSVSVTRCGKPAHWAFVAAALPALTTALPGTLVASYWTF